MISGNFRQDSVALNEVHLDFNVNVQISGLLSRDELPIPTMVVVSKGLEDKPRTCFVPSVMKEDILPQSSSALTV